ncbi:MAG: YidC/Oxa1 family insertase periplasmic-domain containing protein [Planctomycetes bacterium]|nr:YidC/Oxa1 family insertase periplasmic-domain containing protein [Planctomycetota bacterium]
MKPRPVLAVTLCIVLYLMWFIFSTRKEQQLAQQRAEEQAQQQAQKESTPQGQAPAKAAGEKPAVEAKAPQPPRPAYPRVKTALSADRNLAIDVTSQSAALAQVALPQFKNYFDPKRELVFLPELEDGPRTGALRLDPPSPNDPPFPPLDQEDWETQAEPQKGEVEFRNQVGEAGAGPALAISKKISTVTGQHHLLVTLAFENRSAAKVSFQYSLWGPVGLRSESLRGPGSDLAIVSGSFSPNGPPAVTQNFVSAMAKTGSWENPSRPAWVGYQNNYFAGILAPVGEAGAPKEAPADLLDKCFAETFVDPASREEHLKQDYPGRALADLTAEEKTKLEENAVRTARCGVRSKLIEIEPGQSRTDRYLLYLGPRHSDYLAPYAAFNFDAINSQGWTTWLVNLFLWILPGLHWVTRSWGLAIVCLTILVRLALHPINRRQQVGMMLYQKKISKIQPQLQELKERYGGDRLKLNQEMQKLFKENNINPAQMMGGCLMVFLQLPVWIGLINTLGVSLDLRQAPFLWIKDLSQPDRLFVFDHSIGFLPTDLNILPVLYVALMMVQQKMQPKPTDPQAQQTQKMMSIMMIAFGFIFYGFASGLLVYFLASAIFGLIETKVIKRIIKRQEERNGGPALAAAGAPSASLYPPSKGVIKPKKPPKEKSPWR